MKRSGGIRILIVGIILVALVVGYYYYLSNIKGKNSAEQAVTTTKVQNALLRDLDKNYPPTPKEVIKFYSELTQCIHNEPYNDEEFDELVIQMYSMYDEELAANNPLVNYTEDVRFDVESMKKKGYAISSYSVYSSTDVDYYTVNGDDCAQIKCTYTLRTGSTLGYNNQNFILRKDENGRWKILGWYLEEE